jgi:hypothetical protein
MERPEPRPSVLRLILVALGLSVGLSVLFLALVGGRGMRKHVFEASITTEAAPNSLLAAILDPEAVARIAGEVPGYGRLVSALWDGPPRVGAKVVETYERGTQTYVVTDFEPPVLLEERYELEDDPRFSVVEQRWTIREGDVRRLELRNVLYPRSILGGFALEMASGQEPTREPLVAKLRALEQWALEHPVETTSAALSRVQRSP